MTGRPPKSVASTAYDDALAWLPLIWHPGLVFLRIGQLQRVVEKVGIQKFHNPPHADAVFAYARECGIVWATHWHIETRSRPLIICPQCKALAWRLIEDPDGAWRCRRCMPWPETRTERLLAEFLCGLRIGLRHRQMELRRRRLLRRLRDAVPHARTAFDLVRLSEGAELLGSYRVKHHRRGMRDFFGTPSLEDRLAGGPVWRAAAHHLVPALIDDLLHPTAYQARYGALRRAA